MDTRFISCPIVVSMLVRVNKRIPTRKPVKYSALQSGTISHVWSDDEFEESLRQKRRNVIRLTRDVGTPPEYDA